MLALILLKNEVLFPNRNEKSSFDTLTYVCTRLNYVVRWVKSGFLCMPLILKPMKISIKIANVFIAVTCSAKSALKSYYSKNVSQWHSLRLPGEFVIACILVDTLFWW